MRERPLWVKTDIFWLPTTPKVWREVLGTFQSFPYEESKVDKVIYWDNVNGYKLTLSDHRFRVSQAN